MTANEALRVRQEDAKAEPENRKLRIALAIVLTALGLFLAVALLAQHYVNYGRWAYHGPYPVVWGANLKKMGDRQRAILFTSCSVSGGNGVREARFIVRPNFPPSDAATDQDHKASSRFTSLTLIVPWVLWALAFFVWRRQFSLRVLVGGVLMAGLLGALPLLLDRRDFEYGAVECQTAYPANGFSLDREYLLASLAPERVAGSTPPRLLKQLNYEGQFAVVDINWAPHSPRQHLTFDNDAVLELHFRHGTDTPTRERCVEWYATFLGLTFAHAFHQKGYGLVSGQIRYELYPSPAITRVQDGWKFEPIGSSYVRTFNADKPVFEFNVERIEAPGGLSTGKDQKD